MQSIKKGSSRGCLYLALLSLCMTAAWAQPDAVHIQDTAIEAYIYGYPLVSMEMTRRVMTNVQFPTQEKAPMGQFAHMKSYPTAAFHERRAPNTDTLYSTAWVDLSKEPYVLELPDAEGHYYLMPILSAWTEVLMPLGTRTTGTKAARYLITGPGWEGSAPEDLIQIPSPTNLIWILGRTYCNGTNEDYRRVHLLQKNYILKPLSALYEPYVPTEGVVDAEVDMHAVVGEQVNNMDIVAYFNLLSALMVNNPPTAEDAPMLEKMQQIGVAPGKEFDMQSWGPDASYALRQVPTLAIEKVQALQQLALAQEVNGWVYTKHAGHYGTEYLQRALIALSGLGANLPQDTLSPYTLKDAKGELLNGAKKYVIHFAQEELPPVKGFWSLTLYNAQYFFVPNILRRYSLSLRDPLHYNQDGSLDLYIQHNAPDSAYRGNWLPAPEGDFILMMRLYWPEAPILLGKWVMSKVEVSPERFKNWNLGCSKCVMEWKK